MRAELPCLGTHATSTDSAFSAAMEFSTSPRLDHAKGLSICAVENHDAFLGRPVVSRFGCWSAAGPWEAGHESYGAVRRGIRRGAWRCPGASSYVSSPPTQTGLTRPYGGTGDNTGGMGWALSGIQALRRDDQGLRELRGELGCRAEQRPNALGILHHILRHLIGRGEPGNVLSGPRDADDVPTEIGHVQPQRHLRVVADVAQLHLRRLAVDKDCLVITQQEPHRHAVGPPIWAHGRQPRHQVGTQPPLHMRAAVTG